LRRHQRLPKSSARAAQTGLKLDGQRTAIGTYCAVTSPICCSPFPRSFWAERVLVYGISVARASPFWSGQAGPRGPGPRGGAGPAASQLRGPARGRYRPGLMGAPSDRLEDGCVEDYEPRRNSCAGKFTLESSSRSRSSTAPIPPPEPSRVRATWGIVQISSIVRGTA
jgi:hypothetical protein